ncbi:MAG: hypothetical protein A2729_01290 [Candidatus Buchananbacteria bacterium RIFCSPHIGHO2_01_FULL_39_14]|uniref:Uncharacterized protein n=2 Tax=Candidatus Buchananiibacteriota TaxID=1817903 RepID=A0A1G1YVU0_9BACT|nr:MAG: hypothetical protein A2729_01290 [Candidatus Buchananbacteria bacterium RIFCSPHIGHO2_01_FULL_39_14]OGY49198.1 MAG: hypothetical protein A3D39_00315 [Candidatus Buchananbacteria bacterium RIFCSPHIGHO2_02_FULL_39_17]OGY55876.1 MAG: hypothetical protein A2912_02730 [Candidatus Buchananbacteria bacterium RIFCSPLOWO2_01_FULL_40_23b]
MKVAAYQQPHVLKKRLQEAGMTHDQKARVDLVGVHTGPSFFMPVKGIAASGVTTRLFFCRMTDVHIKETIAAGDGNDFSGKVCHNRQLKRLLPRHYQPGITIKNVLVHCNGTITLTADEQTQVVIGAPAGVHREPHLISVR